MATVLRAIEIGCLWPKKRNGWQAQSYCDMQGTAIISYKKITFGKQTN